MDGFTDTGGLSVGFKLEGIVRSPVLLNFVRVYGGLGPAVFYGLTGTNARQVDGNWFAGNVDGNWFIGTEVFFHPGWSVHWELGTSGGSFDDGSGGYTSVGVSAYL